MSEPLILNFNFLSDHKAAMGFTRGSLKEFEFNLQSFSIPGISVEPAKHPMPLIVGWVPGDHPEYERLNVTIIVDERLKAWKAIHDWMVSLYSPRSQGEYSAEDGKIQEEAYIIVTTAKNNPFLKVKFKEVFPTVMGKLDFISTKGEDSKVVLPVTFSILDYEVEILNEAE